MTDIFDEVDEILSDVDTAEAPMSAESESNFNESELHDIMAEIESLEKGFEAPEVTIVEETPVSRTQLQEEIERELALSQEVCEDKKVEIIDVANEEIVEEPKVLSFEKKTATAPVSSPSSEISFAANGQMNLNLSFKIGVETAHLTVDPEVGLSLSMNGVELCICEKVGCKVTMENGVSFTIPLTSATPASKKKKA